MQPPENRGVDWTGIHPDDSPIGPLDGRSFAARLRMLSERARDLNSLRRAWPAPLPAAPPAAGDAPPATGAPNRPT